MLRTYTKNLENSTFPNLGFRSTIVVSIGLSDFHKMVATATKLRFTNECAKQIFFLGM